MMNNIVYRVIAKAKRDILFYRKAFISKKYKKSKIDCVELPDITGKSFEKKCIVICEYFINEYLKRSSYAGTRVFFDGLASNNNADIDLIESSSRLLPLVAVCLKAVKNECLNLSVDMLAIEAKFRTAILNAASVDSDEYWGDASDRNQLIVEVADYALALWLTKDFIWDKYEIDEKEYIKKWLVSFIHRDVVDNNWHLFQVIIDLIVSDIYGIPFSSQSKINRIESFLHDEGWFIDGPNGYFDLYNAWAFHYTLFWIYVINKELCIANYPEIISKFCNKYKYLFSRKGFPIFGRSPCYKYALPVPLLVDAILSKSNAKLSIAISGFNSIWDYYSSNEVIKAGRLPQGVLGDQPEFLDSYSGPGSSLWGLRSVIISIYEFDLLSKVDPVKLPIEISSYTIDITPINVRIFGDHKVHDITLEFKNNKNESKIKFKSQTILNKFLARFFLKPFRPNNNHETYKLNKVSNDNRIYKQFIRR